MLAIDFDDKVLPSIVNEVTKQVVAQFTAAELIFQRDHVSRLIIENLVRAVDTGARSCWYWELVQF